MCRIKLSIYRVRYYLWVQASSGGLWTYSLQIREDVSISLDGAHFDLFNKH